MNLCSRGLAGVDRETTWACSPAQNLVERFGQAWPGRTVWSDALMLPHRLRLQTQCSFRILLAAPPTAVVRTLPRPLPARPAATSSTPPDLALEHEHNFLIARLRGIGRRAFHPLFSSSGLVLRLRGTRRPPSSVSPPQLALRWPASAMAPPVGDLVCRMTRRCQAPTPGLRSPWSPVAHVIARPCARTHRRTHALKQTWDVI